MSKNVDRIAEIRSFNRFYTNILGLLDSHILESGYTLTEARILFEIGRRERCTANDLSTELSIDKSYMSRIIHKFEQSGLLTKEMSCADNRANIIQLSKQGLETVRELNERSNAQIEALLSHLDDNECGKIYEAMQTIKRCLIKSNKKIIIRPFQRNDRDFMISRQILFYEIEYGFTSNVWKAYVTDGVNHLIDQYEEEKDCIYILECNDILSGCIAIQHVNKEVGQLRFFFLEAEVRGLGAGRELFDRAIVFCREKQYKQIFLWTFSTLEAARHLYQSKGFQITQTHEKTDWGAAILEERWDLTL
jgi:DNA-binding MarR family transcriptional regulator/N-acetylglutamate synthase-like GNAT family acetyltransferase